MKSIEKITKTIYEIQKSKFICILYPLSNLDDVNKYLEECKKEYKGATHYCYAYIFDQTKRFQDDGEPGGTAGMPILNVLENNELNHVLAVVIRYFGGIKLGAGGLVRAYTNSTVLSIKEADIIHLIKGYNVEIVIPYDEEKILLNYINKDNIISKEYGEKIKYILFLEENNMNQFKYDYHIIEEALGKKTSD